MATREQIAAHPEGAEAGGADRAGPQGYLAEL